MQAHPYLPEVGRFLTEDRYESAAGDLNLETDTLTQDRYAFAGGNPVNNIEEDGHEPASSFNNGCDNMYGSDDRCAKEPKGRRQAAARRPSYTESSNWRRGRATSPQQDKRNASNYAQDNVGRAYAQQAASTPAPQARPKPAKDPGALKKTLDFVNESTISLKAENPSCVLKPNSGCQAFSLFDNDLKKGAAAAGSWVAGGILGKGLVKGAAAACAKLCPKAAEKLGPLGRRLGDETGSVGGGVRAESGRQFVTTPRGVSFDIPGGWKPRTAENGRGTIYQRPGASGNADSVRIMEPTKQYPKGYFRYYNQRGQPLDARGKPGSRAASHFPEDYQGPLPGWPR